MCVLDLTACQVAEQLMTIAYESGVNLFDTAEVYAGGRWVIHRPVFLCNRLQMSGLAVTFSVIIHELKRSPDIIHSKL